MAPFVILVIVSVLLRGIGWLGIGRFSSWEPSARSAVVVMFVFTGATHFSNMKYDYAAMVPEQLPDGLWTIYLTGALEIAGAVGLLVPRLRRTAGICLILLLVALFPANVNAALQDIPFRGESPMSLWLRAPTQLVFVAAVWCTSVRSTKDQGAGV